jgi:putative ABC transport system permease protein
MFDLEKSIGKWLKQFRRHRAFDHGHIREMELHLKDHIDDLIGEGHSPESAFKKAVEDFGEIPTMAEEEFYNQKRKEIITYFPLAMYRNYFKIAVRSFTKQPFFTFLNIIGLAIGMAGALLIALYIYDELSYDKMFVDADRIYRINIDNKTAGELTKYASVSGPLAEVIREDYPQQELVTRFREVGTTLIKKADDELNTKEEHVVAVDTTFFSMFGFDLLKGNKQTAFRDVNTLVLSQSAAISFFGSIDNALGHNLLLNNADTYVVTGVIEDMPDNSFLKDYQVFLSMSSFPNSKSLAWNNWNFPTFVKLKPGANLEDFNNYLSTVTERYLIPWAMAFVPGLTVESAREARAVSGNFMNFNSMALTDIHLHSLDREGEFNANSDVQNVYILSFIGLFLVLMASVNFMNLSTAHSLKRAKEVGIRKTLGSNRLGLIRQFLTESALISFLSLFFAITLAAVMMPYFNALSDKNLSIPFNSIFFWIILLSATLILSLLSGSYPAFFISKFAPVKVLSGSDKLTISGGGIRNVLVVFQFSISIFLLVATLVVFQQLNFIQNKDLGYKKDQILIIDNVDATGNQINAFKEEVKKIGQVESVSLSSFLPTPSDRNGTTFFRDGMMDSEGAIIIGIWRIDQDYIPMLGMELIAGRNFDEAFATDSSALLINESALEMLKISADEAIGMRLTDDFHRDDKENMNFYTIIGVVKNFNFESLKNQINGLSFSYGGKANKMLVKLKAGNFTEPIENIEAVWHKLSPGQPFNYYFMDDSFNDTYQAEARLGSIILIFTVLSIIIASLGLFGLAAFNTERRSKEIGIRKVLGASIRQIVYKLSIDFMKLVLISIVVALPLSWFIMNMWLEDFTYRIEIGGWLLLLSACIAIVISIITVSYQSIKAAITNPVNSLKTE